MAVQAHVGLSHAHWEANALVNSDTWILHQLDVAHE